MAAITSAQLPSSKQKERRSDFVALVVMLERARKNVLLEGAAPFVVSKQAQNPAIALIASEIGPANSLACSQSFETTVTEHRAGGLPVAQRSAQAGFVAAQPLSSDMPPLRSMKTATTT